PHDHARRHGAPVPRREDAAARVPERPRRGRRLDLARLPGLQPFPRRLLDEGAVPELPREDEGLRRLPLSGVSLDRRRGERGPGRRPLAGSSPRDRGRRASGRSARRGEAVAVLPRREDLARDLLMRWLTAVFVGALLAATATRIWLASRQIA